MGGPEGLQQVVAEAGQLGVEPGHLVRPLGQDRVAVQPDLEHCHVMRLLVQPWCWRGVARTSRGSTSTDMRAAGPGCLGEQGPEGPGRRLGVLDLGDDTPAPAHGRRAEQLDLGPEGGGQGGQGRAGLLRLRPLDQDQPPGRGSRARPGGAARGARRTGSQRTRAWTAWWPPWRVWRTRRPAPRGPAPGGGPAPGPVGVLGRPDLGLAEGGVGADHDHGAAAGQRRVVLDPGHGADDHAGPLPRPGGTMPGRAPRSSRHTGTPGRRRASSAATCPAVRAPGAGSAPPRRGTST